MDIRISIIYLENDVEYTNDIFEDVKKMKEENLFYYIFCGNCIIFSDVKLTIKEAKYLVKVIENDKGFNFLNNEGFKTKEATYYLA